MKTTLSTEQAANMLIADPCCQWSHGAARALVEYLEELEDDLGETFEFDAVAIRCDWTEYNSALEAAEDFGAFDHLDGDEQAEYDSLTDEEKEAKSLDWLRDETQVVEFDGGVVVQAW